ncbi:MAG: hypothetical protein KDK36_20875 [Leptospiraceae bacterium]|nr:hypothetical protein [Leptospiraceae bacterium]
MCTKDKRYYNIKIFLVALLYILNCISLPEDPINHSPDCLTNFFSTRKQIKNLQTQNALENSLIVFQSYALAWIYAPLFSLAVLSFFNQYDNKLKAEKIIKRWENDDCGINDE